MRSLSLSVVAAFWLMSCAGTKMAPPLPTAKDFEVPTKLADKFAVKDQESPAPIKPPAPPEAAPVAAPDAAAAKKTEDKNAQATPPKKGEKKGKREKAEKAETKEKMKTEPAPREPKKETVASRWTMQPFFQAGEHYAFDITYFGATAGELQLDVLPNKSVADRPNYHFQAHARTSSVFSLFYRLNDMAESYMDVDGLFSHKFSLKIDESLQQRDVLELYDQQKHKVYYWSKLDHKKKGKRNDQLELDSEPFTQDSLSSFFYVRTLPLNIGDVYVFPVCTNGKMKHVQVKAVRKETLATRIGEIPAIVVQPQVVLDGVLQSFGDNFVWISDDPRRIILKVDAKMKVGSVIAYLREHSYGPSGSAQPGKP